MPENVSLAFVRLSSMVAWIADHPGVHVDEIARTLVARAARCAATSSATRSSLLRRRPSMV